MASSSEQLAFAMGIQTLEIVDYWGAKKIGTKNYIESSPFMVGGHEWMFQFYPCWTEQQTTNFAFGVRLLDLTKHARAFCNILISNWEISAWTKWEAFSSELINFTPDKHEWFHRHNRGVSTFENTNYLRDNKLEIKCVLYVVQDNAARVITQETPTDYVKHFSRCLENGVAVDVKFFVKGKTFPAHRWVLAASSTVFKKQFFDTPIAKEKDIQTIIVENMETDTFKSLLYFIYTDSMLTEEYDSLRASALMTQRLLVAADRYKIKKLKSICEKKLCEDITINTAATTLVLAEEHNCCELRSVCIEFLFKNKSYGGRSVNDD